MWGHRRCKRGGVGLEGCGLQRCHSPHAIACLLKVFRLLTMCRALSRRLPICRPCTGRWWRRGRWRSCWSFWTARPAWLMPLPTTAMSEPLQPDPPVVVPPLAGWSPVPALGSILGRGGWEQRCRRDCCCWLPPPPQVGAGHGALAFHPVGHIPALRHLPRGAARQGCALAARWPPRGPRREGANQAGPLLAWRRF